MNTNLRLITIKNRRESIPPAKFSSCLERIVNSNTRTHSNVSNLGKDKLLICQWKPNFKYINKIDAFFFCSTHSRNMFISVFLNKSFLQICFVLCRIVLVRILIEVLWIRLIKGSKSDKKNFRSELRKNQWIERSFSFRLFRVFLPFLL